MNQRSLIFTMAVATFVFLVQGPRGIADTQRAQLRSPSQVAAVADLKYDASLSDLSALQDQLDQKVTAYVKLQHDNAITAGQAFKAEIARRLQAAQNVMPPITGVTARPSLYNRFLGLFRPQLNVNPVSTITAPKAVTGLTSIGGAPAQGWIAKNVVFSPAKALRTQIDDLIAQIIARMPARPTPDAQLATYVVPLIHALNAKMVVLWAPFGVDAFGNERVMPPTAKPVEMVATELMTAIANAKASDSVVAVSDFYEVMIRLSGFDLKRGDHAATAATLDILRSLTNAGKSPALIYAFANAFYPWAVAWYDLASPAIKYPYIRVVFGLRYPDLFNGLTPDIPATADRSQFLLPRLLDTMGNQFSLHRDNFWIWAFDAPRMRVARIPFQGQDAWQVAQGQILSAQLHRGNCTFMERANFGQCPVGCANASPGNLPSGGLADLGASALGGIGSPAVGAGGPPPQVGLTPPGGSGIGAVGAVPSSLMAMPRSNACNSSSPSGGNGPLQAGSCFGRTLGGGRGKFMPGNPEMDRMMNCAVSSTLGGFRMDVNTGGFPDGLSSSCLRGQDVEGGSRSGGSPHHELTAEQERMFTHERERIAGTIDRLGGEHHSGAGWLAGQIQQILTDDGLRDAQGNEISEDHVREVLNQMIAYVSETSDRDPDFGTGAGYMMDYQTYTDENGQEQTRDYFVFSADTIAQGTTALQNAFVDAVVKGTIAQLNYEGGNQSNEDVNEQTRTTMDSVHDRQEELNHEEGPQDHPEPDQGEGHHEGGEYCADGDSCGMSCGFLDARIASFTQCISPQNGPSFPDRCKYANSSANCEDGDSFDPLSCAPSMSLGGLKMCTMVDCASDGSVAARLDTTMDMESALNCCRGSSSTGAATTQGPGLSPGHSTLPGGSSEIPGWNPDGFVNPPSGGAPVGVPPIGGPEGGVKP